MELQQYAAKNYIKLTDLAEGPLAKTIVSIEEGNFDKPEVTFEDGSKLSLNKTSVLVLGKAFGWKSQAWLGRQVEIYAGEVTFQGTTKPSVLVRPIDRQPPKLSQVADQLNDDVPF